MAAVSMTSWLVAPRCTWPAASPPDLLPQSPDERLRGVADRPALLEQLAEVVQLDAAGSGDRDRGVLGDDARGRLRSRERAFDLEHRLEPRPVGDRVQELLWDEERPERRHRRKNAVCSSP